jgi:hypothetical protein
MAQVPTLAQLLAEISPLPIAEGTFTALATGWQKAYYYDPITGLKVTFPKPPTVVATAENRSGSPPSITAPTISIPTVDLPEAPTIDIPTITLPPFAPISLPTIDTTALWYDLQALKGYGFSGSSPLVGPLNDLMALWATAINDLQNFLDNITTAIINARNDLQNIINEIQSTIANAQAAINQYQTNIQKSVNAALASTQQKAQAALNAYQALIQTSLNQGLSQVIPYLYDQIGVPLTDILTPVQIRSVQTDGFEFYALSPGYTIHYVAIGPKT